MSRVLFTTLGSLGDVHPLLAIGLKLRARGHSVLFSTSECYRAKIEPLGFEFQALRPNLPQDTTAMAQYRAVLLFWSRNYRAGRRGELGENENSSLPSAQNPSLSSSLSLPPSLQNPGDGQIRARSESIAIRPGPNDMGLGRFRADHWPF